MGTALRACTCAACLHVSAAPVVNDNHASPLREGCMMP